MRYEGKTEADEVKKFAEFLAMGAVTAIDRIDEMIRRQFDDDRA